MYSILADLFGTGSDLTATQMALRGVVVSVLTLIMFRVSGRRSLGQRTAFDACITVLLGSILGRGVVGASPFWPTVATGAALVVLHRLMAMLASRVRTFDVLINGHPRLLFADGQLHEP